MNTGSMWRLDLGPHPQACSCWGGRLKCRSSSWVPGGENIVESGHEHRARSGHYSQGSQKKGFCTV